MNTSEIKSADIKEGQSRSRDGVPIPSQIAHLVLYTRRFKEMVRWYKTALHMWASHEDDDTLAFLTYDDEHHRVAIVHVPEYKPPQDGVAGFNHVAFTFRTLSDLLVTHERLAGAGIRAYWTVNHGPTTSMYFRDPDGNRIEMQVDNFKTAAEAIAYCGSPEFAENPIGVDFDPVDLLRRLRAGEAEASLKKRPRIGPRGMADFPRG